MASLPIALAAGVGLGRPRGDRLLQQPHRPGLDQRVLLVIVLVAVLVVSMRNQGLGMRERFSFAPRVRPIPPVPRSSVWWVRHHTPDRRRPGAARRARAPVPRHVLVAPLPVRPGHPDGAGRALPHGAHRLGRPALARPVRARGPRRDEHLQPRAAPGVLPGRHRARRRCITAARRGARRRAGAAHARPLPRRHHPGPGGGGTVAALAADLPRRGPRLAAAAPAHDRRGVPRVPAELLLLLPRAPRAGDRRREPGAAQRARPLAARGPRQRARRRRHGDVARADQAVRLRALRRAGGPGGLGPRRAPRAVHPGRVRGHRLARSSWPSPSSAGCRPSPARSSAASSSSGSRRSSPTAPQVALLTSGAGVLILLLYFPGGFVQILFNLRDLALARLAARQPEPAPGDARRRGRVDPPGGPAGRSGRPSRRRSTHALAVEQVSVRFGHRIVVDDVDLDGGDRARWSGSSAPTAPGSRRS